MRKPRRVSTYETERVMRERCTCDSYCAADPSRLRLREENRVQIAALRKRLHVAEESLTSVRESA
jgi:hypothetical protein